MMTPLKIYVASSWRNGWQPDVVRSLRHMGHDVYDFHHPAPGNNGFSWREINENWRNWSSTEYLEALSNPIAENGFNMDMNALRWCDVCIMVLPCGMSAHLELGWAAGAGKKTAVLLPTGFEYEAPAGHSGKSYRACGVCGDVDGCHLPEKLNKVEPELMIKCADIILTAQTGLTTWLNNLAFSSSFQESSQAAQSL